MTKDVVRHFVQCLSLAMLAEASHDAQVGAPMDCVISAKELHDPARNASHLGFHPDVALPLYDRYDNDIAQHAVRLLRTLARVVLTLVQTLFDNVVLLQYNKILNADRNEGCGCHLCRGRLGTSLGVLPGPLADFLFGAELGYLLGAFLGGFLDALSGAHLSVLFGAP